MAVVGLLLHASSYNGQQSGELFRSNHLASPLVIDNLLFNKFVRIPVRWRLICGFKLGILMKFLASWIVSFCHRFAHCHCVIGGWIGAAFYH